MELRCQAFTTNAYWPRTGQYAALTRNSRLNIVYNVWSSKLESNVPSAGRFSLVYVHGAQMTKESWNYYVELSFKCWGARLDKVILIDNVNSGDSALLNGSKVSWLSAWGDVARDINIVTQETIKRGDISGPVVLIGHSMGAMGCILAANFETELYAGIVAFDPVWSGIEPNDREENNIRIGKLGARIYQVARDEWTSYHEYKLFLKKFFSRNFHPRIKQDTEDNFVYKGQDGKIYAKSSRAMQTGGYISSLTGDRVGNSIVRYTPVPVLVIKGDIEDWTPPGEADILVNEVLPRATIKRVIGGGHLIPFEKPHEVFDAFEPFVYAQYLRELEYRKRWRTELPHNTQIRNFQSAQIEKEFEQLISGTRSKLTKL